ncbi:unnamed protein product [Onchocerca ochengi]|uniref:DBD_Tnp_Mut domain-containing protein n=1 Tax=Onchocerca ochengi TaxID=42157 RepID=A0A182EJE4_ONCOC|nr:unnamed protein product [Onchocerca ochengi]
MDLTVLSEQQLQKFVRIVAEDFKIKYEILQRLRAKEINNKCFIYSCMKRKQKEWLILCPFKEEQFGHAKYLCKCPRIDDDDAWYLRAILELHMDYKLGAQIDTAYVCNFSTSK